MESDSQRGPGPQSPGLAAPPVEEPDASSRGDLPERTGLRRARRRRSRRRNAIEWVLVVVGALVVAFLIKTFLIQAFYIPSGSMEPTLTQGDRVLVNKLSDSPGRGDIIVFERPEPGVFEVETCAGGRTTVNVRPNGNEIKDLIKRVIALPGETVEQSNGRILVNGEPLEENYVYNGEPTPAFDFDDADTQCIRVPEDRVFVLGDHRSASAASNSFGPIEKSSIVGTAFVRVWPIGDIGGI